MAKPVILCVGPRGSRGTIWPGVIEACHNVHKGLSQDPYNGVHLSFEMMNMLRMQHQQGHHEPLIKLLLGTHRLATNPRDKVFALLGIYDEPNGVNINYTDATNDVFESAARYSISQYFADLVSTAIQPLSKLGLPSWVPNWEVERKNICYYGYSCATTLKWSISEQFTPGLLTARGMHFGTIQDMGKAVDVFPVSHLTILKD